MESPGKVFSQVQPPRHSEAVRDEMLDHLPATPAAAHDIIHISFLRKAREAK